MRKKGMVAALAACIACTMLCSTGAGASEIREAALEDYIMEEMSSANILGVGVSIVNAEKELYCAAYGAAKETSADYVLGAVSQSLTAAGVMRMAEDGELSLDDTVSDHLPEYDGVADVTIRELLSHTSGITAEQKMSELAATGRRGEFAFSNANYNLLGEVIEEVSGLSYEEYISDNILDALDMASTYSMRMGSDLSGELLMGYRNYFGFPSASRYVYDDRDEWMRIPSSYMISDIKDMGNFLRMYLNHGGDVLAKESVDQMLGAETAVPADSEVAKALFDGGAEYGMGWARKEVNGTEIYYQSGRTESFTTMLVLLPEQEMGIAMMFNSTDYLVGQKMIQTLEEGIVSIETGGEPVVTEKNSYLIQHGVIDGVLFLALLAAWMPIFLMGVWCRRRRNHMMSVPGWAIDVVVHLVLPSVLLFLARDHVLTASIRRFVPDLYYAVWAVILSLYLGAVLKGIAGVVLKILGPKEETPEEADEDEKREVLVKMESGEETAEEPVKEEPEKPEENPAEEEPKKPEEKSAEKEPEEKPTEEEPEKPEENPAEEEPEEKPAEKEPEEKPTEEEPENPAEEEPEKPVEKAAEKEPEEKPTEEEPKKPVEEEPEKPEEKPTEKEPVEKPTEQKPEKPIPKNVGNASHGGKQQPAKKNKNASRPAQKKKKRKKNHR